MTSFCIKPNTVFPICEVKILKGLYVGASVNTGNDIVGLNVNKKQHCVWIVHVRTI